MLRSVHHNGLHRVAAQVDVVLVRPAAFTFITSVSRLRAGFSLHFPVNLAEALEGSLKRLRLERIDVCQLHAPR